MSFPVVTAIAGLADTILRTSSSVASQNAQAAANEYNAQIARQNAQTARSQAAAEEAEIRRRNQQALARQRAGLAQNGLLYSPTGESLLNQTANEAELEALTRRHQGEIRAQGLLAEANLQDHRAARNRAAASSSLGQGLMGAGAGLLLRP